MKIRGIEVIDMYYYTQGNIRYELFYSKYKKLIPLHIREQIIYRINSMNMECYTGGSCIMCGCKTTALQMANKACDKPCYPKMFNKKTWRYAKDLKLIYDATTNKIWVLDVENLKFK